MIIAFETKSSEILDKFLDRYENPESLSAKLSKNSFIEFKITRIKDLVIISQVHLFDEVAKWLIMASVIDLLFSYWLGFKVLFFLGFIFAFIGVLWLSKYFRFFALKINLIKKGHRDKIVFVEDSGVIQKLLYEVEHDSK